MKKIAIGLGAIVVVIIVALFFVYRSLDTIIEKAIEKYGSEITQTTVSLDGVEISPTSGQGALLALNIGNPRGFATDSAFRLGKIKIHLDVGTITKDPIVIKEILVDKPEVTYELAASGSNIDTIKRNVQTYAGAQKTTAKQTDGGKKGPGLIIENLIINNGAVNVSAAALKGKKMSAQLPDIHLRDIGKSKGGASPAEVAEQIMASLTKGIGSAVGTLNLDQLLGSVDEIKKEAVDLIQKEVDSSVKDAQEKIDKQLGETTDKVKKLFKY
ncbi:MAG: hypothetical protein JXO49_01145 [Deltaproteobacteria bacterium]|nr:hypothetical protein [Candidatus Anaeroferrophillus wilburensis]MBN2887932.1 hypothetical protein [Deltaproteobacteria bacterium]